MQTATIEIGKARIQMKNGRRYFDVKKSSKRGKRSVMLAAVSAAGFVFCTIISSLAGGEGASYIGAVGLGCTLLALYGCILGVKELAADEKTHKKPYVGTIASGVMFIIWMTIFFTGIKG